MALLERGMTPPDVQPQAADPDSTLTQVDRRGFHPIRAIRRRLTPTRVATITAIGLIAGLAGVKYGHLHIPGLDAIPGLGGGGPKSNTKVDIPGSVPFKTGNVFK